MQSTAGAAAVSDVVSPRLQAESDADALLAEVAAEEDLLEDFYGFMYERAVLVGSGSSPSKDNSSNNNSNSAGTYTRDDGSAGTRAASLSPRRGAGSPRKNLITGPTATSLSAASAPAAAVASTLGAPSPLLTREIMNAMLPPKSWSDAAGTWYRMVKLTQAVRGDVVQLESALNQLLMSHQARATPICHVREKLFLQVFETIIREAACECPERGLLLLRVRDELRLTIDAYQTLYHNSIAYGRKKAVQAEVGIAELEAEVQRLERRREQLATEKSVLVHDELFVAEQLAEQRRKRHASQEQTRRFLQIQRLELETFMRELVQDAAWK